MLTNNARKKLICDKCSFCLSKCPDCGSKDFNVSYTPLLGHDQYFDDNFKSGYYNGTVEIMCKNCDYFSSSLYSPEDCHFFDDQDLSIKANSANERVSNIESIEKHLLTVEEK